MFGNTLSVGWSPHTEAPPPLPCAVGEAHPTSNNPAILSPLLAQVFPAQVVCAELRSAGDPSLLFPGETPQLGRGGPQRLPEFAAGRLCARRALAEFGFTGFPLRMNSDWRPHWPAGLSGSISHTAGICGAVVARQDQFRAIGLDMEITGQVTPEIWPTICTPEELAWLHGLPQREQTRGAALIFSAKEAFYKCQYSVTEEWLEFDDVSVDFSSTDVNAGSFTVRPCKRIMLLESAPRPWEGRFRFYGSLVVTGMVLKA